MSLEQYAYNALDGLARTIAQADWGRPHAVGRVHSKSSTVAYRSYSWARVGSRGRRQCFEFSARTRPQRVSRCGTAAPLRELWRYGASLGLVCLSPRPRARTAV